MVFVRVIRTCPRAHRRQEARGRRRGSSRAFHMRARLLRTVSEQLI